MENEIERDFEGDKKNKRGRGENTDSSRVLSLLYCRAAKYGMLGRVSNAPTKIVSIVVWYSEIGCFVSSGSGQVCAFSALRQQLARGRNHMSCSNSRAKCGARTMYRSRYRSPREQTSTFAKAILNCAYSRRLQIFQPASPCFLPLAAAVQLEPFLVRKKQIGLAASLSLMWQAAFTG